MYWKDTVIPFPSPEREDLNKMQKISSLFKLTSQFMKGSQPAVQKVPTPLPILSPPFLNFGFSTLFSISLPFKTFYTVPSTHHPPVNLPSSSKQTSLTPAHWRYLFVTTNHNHLSSDETNQANIVVRRVGILGTLYWYKY